MSHLPSLLMRACGTTVPNCSFKVAADRIQRRGPVCFLISCLSGPGFSKTPRNSDHGHPIELWNAATRSPVNGCRFPVQRLKYDLPVLPAPQRGEQVVPISSRSNGAQGYKGSLL